VLVRPVDVPEAIEEDLELDVVCKYGLANQLPQTHRSDKHTYRGALSALTGVRRWK
jgi:hypothetical protein